MAHIAFTFVVIWGAALLGQAEGTLTHVLEDAGLLQVQPVLAHHGVFSVEPLLELDHETMHVLVVALWYE